LNAEQISAARLRLNISNLLIAQVNIDRGCP